MTHKDYPVKVDMNALKEDLVHFLRHEAFEVDVLPAASGFSLEAKKTDTVRDYTGLSAALTVSARHTETGTGFDLDVQRVMDKVGLGVVFGAVAGPFALIPVFGWYSQHKTAERLWRIIGRHVQNAAHQ